MMTRGNSAGGSRFSLILCLTLVVVVAVAHLLHTAEGRVISSSSSSLVGKFIQKGAGEEGEGTKWAVLVAGSNGFWNYRHQADICHAYQILKKGGLKDENIVVMMYDDIANDPENPRKGVIINRPNGENVYKGVPKDYTGKEVNAKNVLAVILGDKKGVNGGSGKVVNSGPNDYIFIYYSDHGSDGLLSMPTGPDLYADELIHALKKKHASGTYKKMVIYVEACEAGSVFDGLLPKDINIYVTTASSPNESSYGTYCPDFDDDPHHHVKKKKKKSKSQPDACLGDLYSVSWMEDCDKHMGKNETLQKQYEVVKKRTISVSHPDEGSHVMQYGDINIAHNDLTSLYIGQQQPAANGSLGKPKPNITHQNPPSMSTTTVDQYEAHLLYLRLKVQRAPQGSPQQAEAQKQLDQEIADRARVDRNIIEIGKYLFSNNATTVSSVETILNAVRPAGEPLVDDWDCFKSMVDVYNLACGPLTTYGKKYTRAFANMCNAGVQLAGMEQALQHTCI